MTTSFEPCNQTKTKTTQHPNQINEKWDWVEVKIGKNFRKIVIRFGVWCVKIQRKSSFHLGAKIQTYWKWYWSSPPGKLRFYYFVFLDFQGFLMPSWATLNSLDVQRFLNHLYANQQRCFGSFSLYVSRQIKYLESVPLSSYFSNSRKLFITTQIIKNDAKNSNVQK